MNVLMIIPSFRPVVGGAERQLEGLVPALRDRNVNVTILTRAVPGLADVCAGDPCTVLRRGRIWPKVTFPLAIVAHLLVHRKGIDIIHCHTLTGPAIVAALTARILKLPLLVKVTRSGPGSQLSGYTGSRLGLWILRQLILARSTAIAISEDVERQLLDAQVSPSRIVRIPNGVAIGERYRSRTHRPITFIYVGRLIARKRIDLLLRAFATAGLCEQARLRIVGGGHDIDQLAELSRALGIAAAVEFSGELAPKGVAAALAESDVFILPSDSEGMSNSLLEAMAAGVAVIGADIPVNAEMIQPGVNGELFGTVDDLARLLRALAGDRDAVEAMGRSAMDIARVKYGYSTIAVAYEALYRKAIQTW
jgi:glycosyltransferase involved in cell wall biosynthesis